MRVNSGSIYNSNLGLRGKIAVTLDADERMMIIEALTKCAPGETDVLPIVRLMDRIMRGDSNGRN